MKNDTIGAVSTPPGSGGIGIIRVSGPEAREKVDGIFASKKHDSEDYCIRAAGEVVRMPSFTLKHGYIYDPDSRPGEAVPEFIDECLVSVMKGPKSYTGEDVVEINSHGGQAVLKRVLQVLFRQGVRPAEPGEFTKRAFLNGRIDLSKAEAVADLIKAQTEESRKAAFSQLSGVLADKIRAYFNELTDTLAKISVAIDYPEYEEDEKICSEAIGSLENIATELRRLAATYDRGRILRDGFRVTIAGRPNAGKSSMLNALLGTERAIVTDIPGTTRDIIEETVDVGGYTVILSDTAGLRESFDPVEKIGVERAKDVLSRCDLIIYVCDGSENCREEYDAFTEFRREYGDKKILLAVNKTDLMDAETNSFWENVETGTDKIIISVKNGGEEQVFEKISGLLESLGDRTAGAVITNERHRNLIDKALSAIERAKASADENRPLDFISYDVWECARAVGEITGENVSDDVIDAIFSKFCLGK